MQKKIIVGVVIIGIIAALSGKYILDKKQRSPGRIFVSGNIEVTDAELSFKIPGQLQERMVSEGEQVKAGQIIAILESAELIREVALREAEVAAAQAGLAELEAGSRPEEIAGAEASLRQTQAELDRWKAEYDRQKKLFEQKVIASRDFEQSRAAYLSADEKKKEAQEHLKLVIEGPRKETIERARAQLQQAKEKMLLAKTRLEYATLASPMSGIVLSDNVEPGEYVVPGTPVVTVADLMNVYLRAYIDESDLGRVKIGQSVDVKTDTYPDKIYKGHISFISSEAEFTPKNVQTQKERVKLVYRIKVDIPNPDMELKPGMPADAEILINEVH